MLRAIFNAVRPTIETHDSDEAPGAKLARVLAASPGQLVTPTIVDLSRAGCNRQEQVPLFDRPEHKSDEELEAFLRRSREAGSRRAERFITGVTIDFEGSSRDGIARFHAVGILRLNGWHPFVATFQHEITNKRLGQPLELLAMAEVLTEAHLHVIDVNVSKNRELSLGT